MKLHSRIDLQRNAAHVYKSAREAAERATMADTLEYKHTIEDYAAHLQYKAARAWKLLRREHS